MGGIWKRLFRTVRSVLSGLLEDHAQQLDDKSLRTLFTEAENVVNSRPEYCLLQQKRQKWNNVSPYSQVGDIVLICDESCPTNQWPLTRVTEIYPSEDGLVRKVLLFVIQSGKEKFFSKTNSQVDPDLPPK